MYRLIGFLATHLSSNEDELVATIKVLAGMLLYPIMWIAIAIVFGFRFDFWMGLSLLVLQPLLGYIALMTVETFDAIRASINRSSLRGQQQAIREEILTVAKSMSSLSSTAAPSGA